MDFLNCYFSGKVYVYYNILPKKELEGLLLGQNVKIAFFIHLHIVKNEG